MCSKKLLGSKPKQVEAPTPAAPVTAPDAGVDSSLSTSGAETNVRAKGKKKLTISRVGSSTGVNL